MEKQRYYKFCELCAKGLFPLTLLLCTAMVGVAIAHVVMRYIFNNALTWSEEFLRFAMVWFALLSAALLHHKKGHVGILIFRDMLPNRLRNFCIRIVPILTFIVAVSVFIHGVQLLIKTRGQYTPALHIPVGVPYAAIPVSFFFMALFAFAQILEITLGKELPERIKYS